MQYTSTAFLNGFRFMLALWVVISHFYTLIGGTQLFKLPGFLSKIILNPITAVYGFMIITGFLMMFNYMLRDEKEPPGQRATFIKFWVRRFFRLYPVYIVMLTAAYFLYEQVAYTDQRNLSALLNMPVNQWGLVDSPEQPAVADYLAHLVMVHGLIPRFHDSLLVVSWSLSLEMQFYILFPLLFFVIFRSQLMTKNRALIFLGLSMGMSILTPGILRKLTTAMSEPAFGQPTVITYVLPLFIFGMICAGVKLRRFSPAFLTVALLIILPFQTPLTTIIITLFLGLLFLEELDDIIPEWMHRLFGLIRRAFSSKFSELGADVSYSLYLVHTLVITFAVKLSLSFSHLLGGSKSIIVITAFLLTLAICSLICYTLFILVEKPFIALGRRIVSRRKSEKREEEILMN